MVNSLFITLEGGEGAGKSTLMKKLAQALRDQGYEVVETRQPGGTRLGEQIREWLLHHRADMKIGPYAELMLFLADRTQHIEEVIAPALKSGKIVLCDRFNDSTVAYQGVARGIGSDVVERLCIMACHGILPQLTLYLDVDPTIGLQRTRGTAKDSAAAGKMDRIESEQIQFHQKVRSAMKELAVKHPERIHALDASQPQPVVFRDAMTIVTEKLDQLQFSQ